MTGLVRQGFGTGGNLAQIIRDGFGAGGEVEPPPPITLPITATITANYWQNMKGQNLELALERELKDREFGEEIRADYRKEVLGIDPVRDEIAALEAIAREPMPVYNGPKPQRMDVRAPDSPIAAQAVLAASAPRPIDLGRFQTALGIPGKPGRFK